MITSVLDYLEYTAGRFGDKTAYCDAEKSYTFSDVMKDARSVASALAKMLHKTKIPIVIFMKKGPHNLAGFFGAVYAGCFYVPIDIEMPDERIKMILDTLHPLAVIYDASTESKVRDSAIWEGVKPFKFEWAAAYPANQAMLKEIRERIKTTDLLYVLFTSGSTGCPKGVTISHAAVIDFIEWICGKYKLDKNTSLCSQAPFYFDASVPDIYIPIKTGATLYIPPKSYYTFPKKILQYISERKINTLIWVPSALCNVVNCNAFEVCVPDSVKLVIFCGEVMPCRHLNVWRQFVSGAEYVNMYGPTEATYACTYYNINREFSDEDKLPLGKACENSEIILLTEEGKVASFGEIGEICILGQCLSYGYYNDTVRTRESFVQNPTNDKWAESLYKTGDLARFDSEGLLVFEGRKDFQIKRLGHRIELGEIENAILANKEIEQACCVFNTDTDDIIAIYSGSMSEKELGNVLKKRLPSYMAPTKLYMVDRLPMNMNGKIDRVELKKRFAGEEKYG